MSLVIGIIGEPGSGKGTCMRLLSDEAKGCTVLHMTFSSVLKETLELWGVPHSRKNLALLSPAMLETYGSDALAEAVKKRITASTHDIIVLDGVRWSADAALVRSFPKNLLIYITANPSVRFARLTTRKEKSGEENMTFEQFLSEDGARPEQEIAEIGKSADVRIENNGTEQELLEKIKNLWSTRMLPLI